MNSDDLKKHEGQLGENAPQLVDKNKVNRGYFDTLGNGETILASDDFDTFLALLERPVDPAATELLSRRAAWE